MTRTTRIVLLLGKPPRADTVPDLVVQGLRAAGARVDTRYPHEEEVPAHDPAGADLVVHRGLSGQATGVVHRAHRAGVRLCNPWPGSRRAGDRAAVARALGARLAPRTRVTHDWAQVRLWGRGQEVVVKDSSGRGRGAGVLVGRADELGTGEASRGPWVVQPYLANDGTDHKLYVVGDRVWGLRKPSPLSGGHRTGGAPFPPDAELQALALHVGAVLGLHLYGVDVLRTAAGPVVVDVNVFPGYRGVDGAATAVVTHLLTHPH